MLKHIENHLSEDQIEDYALSRVPEADEAGIEEHLLVCPSCQERMEESDRFVQAMLYAATHRERAAVEIRAPHAFWPAWALAAAVFVFAVVLPLRNGPLASPFPVDLTVSRGAADALTARVPPGRPLVLRVDLTELPVADGYRLQLVDSSGANVWAGAGKLSGRQMQALVARHLHAGQYWVRVYLQGHRDTPLREFSLKVS